MRLSASQSEVLDTKATAIPNPEHPPEKKKKTKTREAEKWEKLDTVVVALPRLFLGAGKKNPNETKQIKYLKLIEAQTLTHVNRKLRRDDGGSGFDRNEDKRQGR